MSAEAKTVQTKSAFNSPNRRCRWRHAEDPVYQRCYTADEGRLQAGFAVGAWLVGPRASGWTDRPLPGCRQCGANHSSPRLSEVVGRAAEKSTGPTASWVISLRLASASSKGSEGPFSSSVFFISSTGSELPKSGVKYVSERAATTSNPRSGIEAGGESKRCP